MDSRAINYDPEATASNGSCCLEFVNYIGESDEFFNIFDSSLSQQFIDSAFWFNQTSLGQFEINRYIRVYAGACEGYGEVGELADCFTSLRAFSRHNQATSNGYRVRFTLTFRSALLPDYVVLDSFDLTNANDSRDYRVLSVPCPDYHEDSASIVVHYPLTFL